MRILNAYDDRCLMDVIVHPHALKHLLKDEVLYAWASVTVCVRREAEQEPWRWLAIGWLSDGRDVELVAVEIATGWLIIHAKHPVEKKFFREIMVTTRRMQ